MKEKFPQFGLVFYNWLKRNEDGPFYRCPFGKCALHNVQTNNCVCVWGGGKFWSFWEKGLTLKNKNFLKVFFTQHNKCFYSLIRSYFVRIFVMTKKKHGCCNCIRCWKHSWYHYVAEYLFDCLMYFEHSIPGNGSTSLIASPTSSWKWSSQSLLRPLNFQQPTVVYDLNPLVVFV
jgi:hypothetical protein